MIRNVVQGLLFYPRGGSAQVVRYLSAALSHHDVRCEVVSGSWGNPGDRTHAPTFFREVPVLPVDYSPAIEAAEHGADSFLEPIPLHPSYEDRRDVPDRIFTSVPPDLADRFDDVWAGLLRERITTIPDAFHLHHLTPLQHAAKINWPDVPIIGHLHGTELGMLELARERLRIALKLGLDLVTDAERVVHVASDSPELLSDDERGVVRTTRWEYWRYAAEWERRLLRYAHLCDRIVVLSDEARDHAAEALNYDRDLIHPMPNGVDTSRFYPERLSVDDRKRRWRQWLVEDPQGWDESGQPGTVRYSEEDIDEWFADETGNPTSVLLFVGRFVRMKRVPLLIRAYKRAQERFSHLAPLVIWGGSPGEWEGEHPVTVAREEDVKGVFFVGWRGHSELPYGLNASDVMVAPSVNEPFGQVYIEAMACALPVVGTSSGGPLSFINVDEAHLNGWLVAPDDEEALAEAIVEVVDNSEQRRKRGENALELVQARYSWDHIAEEFLSIYDFVAQHSARSGELWVDDGGGQSS
jgi:D-inositol-3-phosphate glycosyltransferase